MKLIERLKVIEEALNTKTQQVAKLDITRQILIKEILQLKGKHELAKELLQEKQPKTKK